MSKPKGIFLVAQYFAKPKRHVKTQIKGWMDNPDNIQWDEKVEISRGLRTRDMHAQVILDLSNKKVERNTFNSGKTFDDIFKHFFANYSEYVIKVMGQLDPTYLEQIVNELEKEVAASEQIPLAEINEKTPAE
jgi:hypothetical protein